MCVHTLMNTRGLWVRGKDGASHSGKADIRATCCVSSLSPSLCRGVQRASGDTYTWSGVQCRRATTTSETLTLNGAAGDLPTEAERQRQGVFLYPGMQAFLQLGSRSAFISITLKKLQRVNLFSNHCHGTSQYTH